MKPILLGLLLLTLAGSSLSAASTNSTPDVLATLKPSHPRLLIATNTWEMLRQQRAQDVRLDELLARIEANGRGMLKRPLLKRELEGKRLLAVSRQALDRIMVGAFCFRLTGDKT